MVGVGDQLRFVRRRMAKALPLCLHLGEISAKREQLGVKITCSITMRG